MKRLFLILTTLVVASVALGYTYITNPNTGLPFKWPAGQIAYQINVDDTTALSDGTTRATTIQAAMQSWNAVIGTAQFQWQIMPAGTAGNGNSVNEVIFDSAIFGKAFDASTLAVTTPLSHAVHLVAVSTP